jgi:drug/metabolite transporter (DMT)-like permease
MPKSNLLGTGMEMLMGAVALFIMSVITGELNGFSFAQVSTRSWLGLLYLITFGSLVGFVSYGWLLQNAPISLTSTYAYVNPMVAVFLGYFLAGEELSGRILIASIIIVGSVIMINRARQIKSRTESLQAVPDGGEQSP